MYQPRPEDPRVVLELEPSAAWVVEQYPVEEVESLGDGRLRVRLVAGQRAWLERLLLRLGPAASVVEGDPGLAAAAACPALEPLHRRLASSHAAAPSTSTTSPTSTTSTTSTLP